MDTNFGTRLRKIIKRAGVKVWPKLYQNLHSTRETELARVFPLHLVCAWIGNSKAIAAKHYLQITDADFEQAAHTAAQHTPATPSTDRKAAFPIKSEPLNCGQMRARADEWMAVGGHLMGGEGLEPTTLAV